MNELRELLQRAAHGAEAFQELQARYDQVGWQIKEPRSAKLRHITLHLMKTVGALGGVCESQEHLEHNNAGATGDEVRSALKAKEDEISQLLISAIQLATLAEVDLNELLPRTYVANAKRFAPNSEFARLLD